MKTFKELTKKELSELNETQVSAYIDVTLAEKGIERKTDINIDFPDYLAETNREPERDVTVYKVGDKVFTNMEDAREFAKVLVGLKTVRLDYDYSIDSDYIFIIDTYEGNVSVETIKAYSKNKFTAIKSQLEHIAKLKAEATEEDEIIKEDCIDYNAIDEVKEAIRSKVRNAYRFFEEAEEVARKYNDYFTITNDMDKTFETLFKVYNITDDDMKEEIKTSVANQHDNK